MSRWLLLATALLLLGASAPGTVPQRRPWTDYNVIAQRNMFTRRGVAVSRPPSLFEGINTQVRVTPTYWVLAGTAILAGDRVAFLEDTGTRATIRAREHDTTPMGRITRIAIDHIRLDTGREERVVKIGTTLSGQPLATTETPSAAATTTPAATVTSPTDASLIDIIARMRARREQETNRTSPTPR